MSELEIIFCLVTFGAVAILALKYFRLNKDTLKSFGILDHFKWIIKAYLVSIGDIVNLGV